MSDTPSLTSLEFIFPAEHIHQELDNQVHWCKSVREEQETNDDRKLLMESERVVKRFVVHEE
jgi:hypothetical protein